ncbi:hypothetical protein GMD88_13575 [Pseudoflavonifractor sp. BIOML-A6]|nr:MULTISPECIES: RDD family protein [unclassified Pseudoflavonifractor]KAB4866499.1 RDD family protein [Bacteroides thetaiotaomicron]MTQ97610.1 hypothetical protein [Pseudoflavonifractor sp. BIOML-A16]MTR07818.1 hypothetical protein [Pseudoflavonifractor sp. BIOML-A15]MTR73518.1 hypothetical protein [Pseudoflavonifractor sp. BIOML-A18]MTS65967.1 hypothetical protein [Pseudoflavonifractor sp. BIOML-A5]MTS73403.1 hypothetical protein [Pseudoflavonifractor sp. BIOML-A8]MTS90670.1 hypothetical p
MREMKEEIKNLFTRERILRLAAFSIDILVLALILSLCTLTLGKPNFAAARGEMDAIVQITDFEARQAQTEVAVAAFSRAYNLSVAVWLGYEVLTQLALGGQTVGKKLCGLRIVSRRPSEGRLKTLGRLTLRTLVKGLCLILFQGFPIFIAWFYILANSSNCAGYDLLAGTKVVARRERRRAKGSGTPPLLRRQCEGRPSAVPAPQPIQSKEGFPS